MDTMTVVVDSALAAPPKPTITQSGDTLTSSPANTYQWVKDGAPVGGATSQDYLVTATGTYQVIITDTAGCSNTSDTIYVVIVNIDAYGSLCINTCKILKKHLEFLFSDSES